MKLLVALALLQLAALDQAFFLLPAAAPSTAVKTAARPGRTSRLYSSAGALLGAATHPLASRKIQISDNEDE